MPDGLLLYGTGLVCLAVFVAIVVRRDRSAGGISTPGAGGWLVLVCAGVCFLGGTWLLATSSFSG